MKFVPNWKQSWKWFTTWAHTAQIAVAGTWAVLPTDLKTYLPPKILVGIVGFLGVVGVFGRLIDQSKPQ